MKNLTLFTLFFHLFLAASLRSQSLFEHLGGPPGGALFGRVEMMNNGWVVAVGSESEGYRLPPGGTTWERITNDPAQGNQFQKLMVPAADGNLYLSTVTNLYRSLPTISCSS